MSRRDFISLRSISKSYDRNSSVLKDFNLDIEEGSFVSILGTSGSGKSTLLNLIAGFIKPDSGKILLNGIDIKDVPPYQRPTATVFQDYALFPHMNVFENIAFGLRKMFTFQENVSEQAKEKIEGLYKQSIEKSNSKIKKLNFKVKQFKSQCTLIKQNLKNLKKNTFSYF